MCLRGSAQDTLRLLDVCVAKSCSESDLKTCKDDILAKMSMFSIYVVQLQSIGTVTLERLNLGRGFSFASMVTMH